MAKKTAKKAAAKKTPSKNGAEAPTTAPVKKAAAKPAAPAVTNEQIGHAAGEVWGALHDQGWQTLASVKKSTGGSADLTLLAIGWLAREGKIDFTTSGRSVKLALK